jgi:O-antigen/teichoic acid export membrane protein
VAPQLKVSVAFGAAAWIVPTCLAIVVTPVVVRGLGTAGFGLYSFLTGFLAVTFTSGLGRAFIQRASGNVNREDAAAWFGTTFRLAARVGAAGGVAAALLVAVTWTSVSAPGAGPGARVAAAAAVAVAFAASALFQVLVAVPLATFRFGDYTWALLAFGVLQLGGNAVLAGAGAGPIVLVLWAAAANVLAGAFVVLRARPSFPVGAALRGRVSRPVAGFAVFGGAVFVYQLSGYLQLLFERWWIGRTLGLEAVAFYAVSMTLALQLHAGVAYMARGILPAASAARNTGGAADLGRLYSRALRTLAPPLVVIVVTLVSLRVEILSLWMGPAFAASAGDALGVLAVSFGLLALLIVPWEFLEAGGFPAGNSAFGVAWLFAGVAANLVAVPRWGIAGAALGRLTLLVLVPVYVVAVERKLFGGVRLRLWISIGTLAAAFGAAAAAASRLVPPLAGGGAVGLAAGLAACGLLAAAAAFAGRRGGNRPG